MQEDAYKAWMLKKPYSKKRIGGYLSENRRVEIHYGDLDAHFNSGQMEYLVSKFDYTVDDRVKGRANPTTLEILGNLYENLAAYKKAVRNYKKFRINQHSSDSGA